MGILLKERGKMNVPEKAPGTSFPGNCAGIRKRIERRQRRVAIAVVATHWKTVTLDMKSVATPF